MPSVSASPWFQLFLSLGIVATAVASYNELTSRSYSRALRLGSGEPSKAAADTAARADVQPPPPPAGHPRAIETSAPRQAVRPSASMALTTPSGKAVTALPEAREVVDRGALRTLRDPSGGVTTAAFVPANASLIAEAGEDHTIRLWNINSGSVQRSFVGHDSGVTALAFSPDGHSLAAGGADNTVRIWNVASGEQGPVLTGVEQWVLSVAWSPDGRLIAAGGGDGAVRLWDARSGAPLRTLVGHQRWVSAVAFSPDGQLLASGSGDFTVRLWRVSSGAELPVLRQHQGNVNALAWTPDSKMIATASADQTVAISDPWSGTQVSRMSGSGAVYAVAFIDARTLAAGAFNGRLQFFDAASGQPLQNVAAHTQSITAISVATGGHQVATAGADGAVRIWPIHTP